MCCELYNCIALFRFMVCRHRDILCSHGWCKGYMASINDPHCARRRLFRFIGQSILSKEGLPPSSRLCFFWHRRGPYSRFCRLRWRKCHYITIRDSFSRSQLWRRSTHLSRSRYFTCLMLNFWKRTNFDFSNSSGHPFIRSVTRINFMPLNLSKT